MTAGVHAFPSRFRRRLAVTFVLVAAFSAGVLAIGSWTGVARYRTASFDESAIRRAELNLRLVELRATRTATADVLESFRREPGSESVVVTPSGVLASDPAFDLDDVPPEAVADGDEAALGTAEVADRPYRVVGVRSGDGATALYSFFSTADLDRSLDDFRSSLAIGWSAVVALAAVVGTIVARHALRPVHAAADAAHSLAEGLLATRLPVTTDDEFGAWAEDFNRMAGALEERIGALSAAKERERRFAADVAHELRTPLASLVAAASILEERLDDLPPGVRRPAELLVTEASRLRRLVEDLLQLFRMESGQEHVDLEELALDRVAAGVVTGLGLDGDVALDGDGETVAVADRRCVERVVANFVSNAVQHGGSGVVVGVARRDGRARIDVTDAGPGIPDEDRERLFDRFFKVDRARSGGGVGLGLAIAMECARATGGEIEVSSAPGAGSTFSLVLPAAPAGRDEVAPGAAEEEVAAGSGSGSEERPARSLPAM